MSGSGQMGSNASMVEAVGTNAKGTRCAFGQATVTGSATITTGLRSIDAVHAVIGQDLALGTNGLGVTAAKAATAGQITLKTWKATGSGDATPIAGTGNIVVNWIAFGE